MKHFIFECADGKYESVCSTSMRQAEKDMGRKCVAAFMKSEDADEFVKIINGRVREIGAPKQYYELKKKRPDVVILFRCGDFYETYAKDAAACARTLGITLTWRNNLLPHNYETYEGAMAGFPHHALDTYLPRLIRAGQRVAICDKMKE